MGKKLTKREMIAIFRQLDNPTKQQKIIDELRGNYPARLDRHLDDCGHYNCQYHGLCAVVELRKILEAVSEHEAAYMKIHNNEKKMLPGLAGAAAAQFHEKKTKRDEEDYEKKRERLLELCETEIDAPINAAPIKPLDMVDMGGGVKLPVGFLVDI